MEYRTRVNRAVYHAKMLQPFEVPTCRFREREGERRDSIAERGEKNSIAQHLVNVDVHVFRWNGSVSLCAWLSRAQYEHMVHSGDSAWFTETWLSGLEPDPTVAPASSTMLGGNVLFRESKQYKDTRSAGSLMLAVPKRLRSLFHRRGTRGTLSMSSDRWPLAFQDAMTLSVAIGCNSRSRFCPQP